jgi:hypothetical protein
LTNRGPPPWGLLCKGGSSGLHLQSVIQDNLSGIQHHSLGLRIPSVLWWVSSVKSFRQSYSSHYTSHSKDVRSQNLTRTWMFRCRCQNRTFRPRKPVAVPSSHVSFLVPCCGRHVLKVGQVHVVWVSRSSAREATGFARCGCGARLMLVVSRWGEISF